MANADFIQTFDVLLKILQVVQVQVVAGVDHEQREVASLQHLPVVPADDRLGESARYPAAMLRGWFWPIFAVIVLLGAEFGVRSVAVTRTPRLRNSRLSK